MRAIGVQMGRILPVLCAGLAIQPAGAADLPAFQLTDIATLPAQPLPMTLVQEAVQLGPHLYFRASTPATGGELWRSDGTPEGTSLVRDIRPGASGSQPEDLTVVGDTLYFRADDGSSGVELWRSDGTAAGTWRVKDIAPGAEDADPGDFATLGGVLYFRADDGTSGFEPWRSDGTDAGTWRVKDIWPGPSGGGAVSMVAAAGVLYFSARDGPGGSGLWRSDGTAAGTWRVANVQVEASGYPLTKSMVAMDGIVYFVGGGSDDELWRSDGTDAGTWRVADIFPGTSGSDISSLVALGSRLYFTARQPDTGSEAWTSDGTPAGTLLLGDIAPGTTPVVAPYGYTAVGGDVFFVADDGLTGPALWKTDGTPGGTGLVLDVDPAETGSGPTDLVALGETLYFRYRAPSSGSPLVLWRSDGSAAGTQPVTALPSPGITWPFPLWPLGDLLLFATTSGPLTQDVLWRTDGTAGGTVPVPALVADQGSSPSELTAVGDRLFFSADDGIDGPRLWTSDGTSAGTQVVLDLPYHDPRELVAFDGALYFRGSEWSELTGFSGEELWSSDGTPTGTYLVHDIPGSSSPRDPLPLEDVLLFAATDPDLGSSIWRTDGTSAGTSLVTGGTYGSAERTARLAGTLYYVTGKVLRSTDGTPGGSLVVKDLAAATGYSHVDVLDPVSLDGFVYFLVRTNTGAWLWRSDGTDAGTLPVVALPGGQLAHLARPQGLVASDSRLFFWHTPTAVAPYGLYVSDGTTGGTAEILSASDATPLLPVNERVFFSRHDGATGEEPWRSDGTPSGTFALGDLWPGPAGSQPEQLTRVGDWLYFSALEPSGGREPWRSDGTPAGTTRVADVVPGSGASNPRQFTRAGPWLYFSASDDATGEEVWAVPASDAWSSLPIEGTAQGGDARVLVGGHQIVVETLPGMTAAEVVAALEAAIAADPILRLAGIGARAHGSSLLLSGPGTSSSSFQTSDPGLVGFEATPPRVPALPPFGIGLVWLALLASGRAALRRR